MLMIQDCLFVCFVLGFFLKDFAQLNYPSPKTQNDSNSETYGDTQEVWCFRAFWIRGMQRMVLFYFGDTSERSSRRGGLGLL